MKYHILINQAGIVNSGLHTKTDVIDWSLLDYIFSWQQSPNAARIDDKVWINYKHLIAEMPLLGLNEKSGVSKRIKKVRELDLLETFQSPDDCRLYAKTTELYYNITQFKGVPKESVTVDENQQGVDENQHSYNHQDTTIKNQKNITTTRESNFFEFMQEPKAELTFDGLPPDQIECYNWAKHHNYWHFATESVHKFLTIYTKPKRDGLKAQFDAHKKALEDVRSQTGLNGNQKNITGTGANYATHYAINKPLTATQRRENLRRLIDEAEQRERFDNSTIIDADAFA